MSFSNLPSDSKRRIASFLDYRSALRLSNISRDFHSDLALSLLVPRYELIYSQIVHGDPITGDIPIKSVRIPIFGNNPHTILLRCRWKDQGWGERKGRLFIVAHPDKSTDGCVSVRGKAACFESGRVVYESPIASHTFESLSITFSPQQHNEYHLFYLVGGGGGHLLIVEDLSIESIVFDDAENTMKNAYFSLTKNGIICSDDDDNDDRDIVFYTKLLMEILKICASNEMECFDVFFEKYKLRPTDLRSLSSIQRVCSFFLEYLEVTDNDADQAPSANESICRDKIVSLSPFTLLQYSTWEEEPGNTSPSKCSRIPFFKRRTKSIRMTCNCHDQGCGTSKGKLYLVAERKVLEDDEPKTQDPRTPFLSGRRLVWESPIIDHESTFLETSFAPDDNETYFLYQDRGVESEEDEECILHIDSLCIHLTVFDDEIGSLESCYHELLQRGALDSRKSDCASFQTDLLLASISFLQLVEPSQTTTLQKFFESTGFGVDANSLRSLKELTQTLPNFQTQQTKKSTWLRNGDADLRMFSCL